MERKVLSSATVALFVIVLFSSVALPPVQAQLRSPTSLTLSPSSFEIKPGESLTLTATLTSNGTPLEGKSIAFASVGGSVSPNIGTTDSNGQVEITYTAPSVETSVTVTVMFAGDLYYQESNASSSGTVAKASTTLGISPPTFTVSSGESTTLTVTLNSGGSPLSGKSIGFTTTLGSVSPNVGTTDQEGRISITYTAPVVSIRNTTEVVAVFAGGLTHKTSSATASGTIEVDEEVQINPTDDAHVAEGYPANNYNDTALYLQSYPADYKNERIFLKFDLSSIPTSAEIVQAKLHLYSWKGRYANVVAQCRAVQDDTWGETTLTWNSQPAHGEVLDTVLLEGLAAENKWHSWDVTSFVRNQFKGDKIASLALRAEVEGASGQYSFESKEWVDATLHPNLEVIYVQDNAQDIMGLLEDVTAASDYRYDAKDDKGSGLDGIKIIENPNGGYLGVYHSFIGERVDVRLAASTDLINWTYVTTLEPDASQPTIAYHAPTGGYLVAFEKHKAGMGNVKFEYYSNIDNLFAANPSKTYDAPRTLSSLNEGTPNIYNINSDLSEIVVGFHYYWQGIVDKVAKGWLTDLLGQDPMWITQAQTFYNGELQVKGVDGNIGDRDHGWLFGSEYNLQEGQLINGDWGSWRQWLYDYATYDFTLLDIKTHKGSTAFGNGTFTVLKCPNGNNGVVVTYFLFSEGAASGEAGELIFYTEYPQLPTDLDLTPSTFTVSSENSLTLTVTLTSDDTPLAGKTIEFTATLGSVNPNTGTTDSEGEALVTYTAQKVSIRTSVTVAATFAGDTDYQASSASSSGTVKARPDLPAVVTITTGGAAFSIPETIKDDVSNFAVTISAEIQNLLPVPVPTTGFLLVNKENLSLVLAQESDKGLASVEGWAITPEITLGGFDLSVIVAKSVSFTKEGTPASIGVIIANPEYYELELVKIDATRRHVSILYDPDDGSGIKFPVTAGYLVENPVSAPELVKAAIRRGKELLLNSGRDIVQGILIKEQTRLPVFDFETDYWIDSPAVTNGIVLLPGSRILRLLENVVPEAGELIQVEANLPVLYDVKTDLKSEPVSSVQEIKQSPDVYRDKVVELTVYGYQGTISIQEYIEAATGGEVKILIDVRLEGMITWNTLSVPPEREELLIAAGASSVEQDTVFETQLAEFRLVGRVVSTKTIDESLPEALALIIFEEEKLRDVTLEELVMERIEENLAELNWTLTNFTEEAIPQIPVTSPSSVVYPVRPVVIQTPEEIPQIRISVRVEVHVEVVTPELPLRLKIDNSKISEVFVDLKQQMEDVRVIAEKLAEKPPELPEPPGLVWAYHEININVPEDAIENAEINFWVLKEWLATQGASKESIRLLRFHEGGWKELPTEILGENATHVSYRARTPGFSVFAIAAPPAGINMMLIGAFIVAIIAVIAFVALKKR